MSQMPRPRDSTTNGSVKMTSNGLRIALKRLSKATTTSRVTPLS